ncbi:MAG: hemolysin family protein [Stellaceae bacterium]
MLWVTILVIFLLILLNGFFAMAEMAIVSARQARLQQAAEDGREGARVAIELKQHVGRFLSTIQIGITAINVLTSVLGGATIAEVLDRWLEHQGGWIAHHATAISFALVVLLISYFELILGELVPKRIALSRPEAIASALSRLLRFLSVAARPIEWFLERSSSLVLWALLLRASEPSPVTDEEITIMMREGAAAGHFERIETAIVQMALRLDDRAVSAVMTPRIQIEWLDLADSDADNRAKIMTSPYSRFPVVEGEPPQATGIVAGKQLLAQSLSGESFNLGAVMRPPLYVPASVTALRALEIFKASGEPMALVVDEYGELEGLLTLHDLMTSLVGDIASLDAPEDRAIQRRDDGSWLIDGMAPVDAVKDAIGLPMLPGEGEGDFHTLGGFIMACINRIPKVGDHTTVSGYRFEVTLMDGRRVDRVVILPPPPVAKP